MRIASETPKGGGGGAAPPGFAPPVSVRVQRIEGEHREDLGVGTLVDLLEAGKSFRLSTGSGGLVATSALRGVAVVAPDVVEARTENSVYRLQKVQTDVVPSRKNAEAVTQRLAMIRKRRAQLGATSHGATGTVAVATPPKLGAGPFASGMRVRVTKIRAADPMTDTKGPLGDATLLDDLEVGAPARFALDGEGAVVTSDIRSMERLGPNAVQVATRNTSYRFERLA